MAKELALAPEELAHAEFVVTETAPEREYTLVELLAAQRPAEPAE